jgi:hypothetical protein
MKQIEITVLPNGETRLETRGFSGAACRNASRPLIEALGLATKDRPTPEFYAAAGQSQPQHEQESPG